MERLINNCAFYNEENLLEQSVQDLVKKIFLKKLLVNDGSSDSSKTIALNLEEKYEI